jgi:O-antigen/teichoic acid export membrane protein
MKQSIGLVILQVIGIVLGLVSVFWVAGSLPPEEYAVVGIYNIISTLILVFSNTGFETYAIRNILSWKEEGKTDSIKLIVTQAITFLTLVASFIFLPVIGYAIYISSYKFEGQYLGLFVLMGFLSISNATNNATVLLLKAFNKYLAAALVTYSVNVFGKLFALLLFIKYGFDAYINTIMWLPLIITLPVIYMLRKNICFKGVFSKINIKKGVSESKFFAVSSYLSYVFNFMDQLLVSIFLSAEILGSFTVAKSILAMSKTFLENIFDPLIQNLVRFKQNIDEMKSKLSGIFKIKNILLIVSIIFIPIVFFFTDEILFLLHLDHYIDLNYYIFFIYIAQVFLIAAKVKYNFICLFFSQRNYLVITAVNSISALIFFFITIIISPQLLFMHLLLTNILMFFYTEWKFKSSQNPYNNEIFITRR